MKGFVQAISTHPKYAKAFEWTKLITFTGGAQILVQAIGLISGIIIIRMLPTHEFAVYTLANTMLGTMTVLSDSGISTGVMAQGGKVYKNRQELGVVMSTGLYLRNRFAIGSLIIAIPLLIYLLLNHGASWLTICLVILSLIPAFFAALSDSLYGIVPKLHQEIFSLQKNQVQVGLGRLLLTGLFLFIFPWAFIGILASGIPRIIGNMKLKIIVDVNADIAQKEDNDVKRNILQTVKLILPGSVFYCFSSQIYVWIVSFFGNTLSLAHIGALGRLAILLNLVSVLFNTLLVPRFARQIADSNILFNQFLISISLLFSTCTVIVFVVYMFSSQLLWILGDAYSNLDFALVLMIIGGVINIISNFLFSLCSSRGWIYSPLLYIGCNVLFGIIGVFVFNITTLEGVLYFNIFISAFLMIMNFIFSVFKIRSIN